MDNIIHVIIACVGWWTICWTLLGLITPTRAKRMRNSFWEKVGHVADRLGIQFKSEKDE